MNSAMSHSAHELNLEEFKDNITEESSGRRWLAIIAAALAILLAALLFADRLFNPEEFQIEEIEVRGDFINVNGEQVRSVMDSAISGNYFSLNLHRLEKSITELPWVFSASLRRKWPSTIVVDVVEVQPVAAWGKHQWLNASGDLVERQGGNGLNMAFGLPKLNGPETEINTVWKAFQQWSEKFASVGLTLEGLALDPRELWRISLSLSALAVDNSRPAAEFTRTRDVIMIVDMDGAFDKTNRFIRALNQQLIDKFPLMDSIDLRYPNGFAINWISENTGQALSEAGLNHSVVQVTSSSN